MGVKKHKFESNVPPNLKGHHSYFQSRTTEKPNLTVQDIDHAKKRQYTNHANYIKRKGTSSESTGVGSDKEFTGDAQHCSFYNSNYHTQVPHSARDFQSAQKPQGTVSQKLLSNVKCSEY